MIVADIIVELYIAATTLSVLENAEDSDDHELPIDHYDKLIDAAEKYHEVRDRAVENLGAEEFERQYFHFQAGCADS